MSGGRPTDKPTGDLATFLAMDDRELSAVVYSLAIRLFEIGHPNRTALTEIARRAALRAATRACDSLEDQGLAVKVGDRYYTPGNAPQ